MPKHHYKLDVEWTGNSGKGTHDYRSYERSYLVSVEGEPSIEGFSDPKFLGDPTKYNPEELLLASLSSCHMLWYLYLCSENQIIVTNYQNHVLGEVDSSAPNGGRFVYAKLQPTITITHLDHIDLAKKLHKQAHQKCFIANSLNFSIDIAPKIQVVSSS